MYKKVISEYFIEINVRKVWTMNIWNNKITIDCWTHIVCIQILMNRKLKN